MSRAHKNIILVQRYCTKCGSKMERRLLRKNFEFDPKTGEKKPVKYHAWWACPLAIFGNGRSYHDGWKRKVPKRLQ